MTKFDIKKGTKVEICSDEEGFQGAWFTGRIITAPNKSNKKILVEYDTLLSDDALKPLRERVDLSQIRPSLIKESNKVFKLDDQVDAFYNDGWWEGVVTQVLYGFKYFVYFRSSKDQSEFYGDDLRLHRDWIGDNWVPPFDHQEAQPTEVKINSEEDSPFSKGSQVEVSSDEEGFDGAWFAANVIEVLEKDKFLVEYRDLMTDDNTQFVREEIDTLHIRPCPPKIEKVDKFKQYDEVDAHYIDGWWVGIISETLSRQKYKVFFRNTGEEIEFKHDELRPHQEWANGKWVAASEALNLAP